MNSVLSRRGLLNGLGVAKTGKQIYPEKEEKPVEVQVLLYMGKPKPNAQEIARKKYKPLTVYTPGTYTNQPKIPRME